MSKRCLDTISQFSIESAASADSKEPTLISASDIRRRLSENLVTPKKKFQVSSYRNLCNLLLSIITSVLITWHNYYFPEGSWRSICSCNEGTVGGEDKQDSRKFSLRKPSKLEAAVSHHQMWGWFEAGTSRLSVPHSTSGECNLTISAIPVIYLKTTKTS